ncbi:LOW QUALITY PROTEIN: protein snail-like [Macrobrachium rosenbergii]|uniref:LOW QUALITY PROTEIN: protein snail-like n=1 Tax=Macrobrachium rosenbergii TaxID=79674 RepID=UPI0034D39B0F
MSVTPPSSKDHIPRPPKKRPLALFNYTLNNNADFADDENMQPEDLSMKSSRIHTPSQTFATTPPPRPSTPVYPRIVAPMVSYSTVSTPSTPLPLNRPVVTSPAPLTPSATPRSDFGGLLGYGGGGGGLNLSSNRPPVTSSDRVPGTGSSFSFNSNMKEIGSSKNHALSSSFASANSSLVSTAGLKLISEVAAACGRPTVLRAPGGNPGTPSTPQTSHPSSIRSAPYAPPTPRDPLRTAMRERGVGMRSWPYHPYLPLGVYGLPSTLHSPATPSPRTVRDLAHPPPARQRGGSVSPPGETGSSSSESSPEAQQQDGSRSSRLTCPDCNRRYATVAGLAKHHQFHCLKDANRSFACKHCDKVYTSLGALKMHIRTHTLPCKCPLCGKAFSRPWLLQGHIRTHTGEKPFQCPQCERCFADRSNLRAHLQTHTDVKKYACRTCPKTFSRMSLLVKHEDHGCPGIRGNQTLSLAPNPPESLSPATSQPSVHNEIRYNVESVA